jgi:2-C-methyl-D-erythritol 4-phosphate cytidylyltransferase
MASAVIVAAGNGLRLGARIKKQFVPLGGEPVLTRTLRAFGRTESVGEIILVVARDDMEYCERDIVRSAEIPKTVKIVPGGRNRQESVFMGVMSADAAYGIVAVHDGVRPFIEPDAIRAGIEAAAAAGASCVAVPVTDTIKVASGGYIERTLDRGSLWAAQTPQTFRKDILIRALLAARQAGYEATDDASLAELVGVRAMIVPGSSDNIKITTPNDLDIANEILNRRGRA